MSCVFCRIVAGDIPAEVIAREPHAMAFLDAFPLAGGHTVVVPTAHVRLVEEMTPEQATAVFGLVRRLAGPIRDAAGAAGSTIGVNNGDATGQTVPHVHVHIVPRTTGDGGTSVHGLFTRKPDAVPAGIGDEIRRRISR